MALFNASAPLLFGMLAMTLTPAMAMAQGRGNRGGGERAPSQGTPGGSQGSGGNRASGFSGGNRGGGQRSVASPAGRWDGGQQFAGGRDRDARRKFRGGFSYYGGSYGRQGGYRRPVYRGSYSSGIYPGLNAPYYGSYYDPYYDPYYTSPYVYDGYGYDRGYDYEPGYEYGAGAGRTYSPSYAAPTYAPSPCTVDAFDQYGRRIPHPNCTSGQQQYPPQGSYNDNAPRHGQQQDNRQQNPPYPLQQQPYPNYDRR